jgi:hypothetical protein
LDNRAAPTRRHIDRSSPPGGWRFRLSQYECGILTRHGLIEQEINLAGFIEWEVWVPNGFRKYPLLAVL